MQAGTAGEPLLDVVGLSVSYVRKGNVFGRPTQRLTVVDDVSFQVYAGETLALLGESGCG
jgi:ABC-type glutathione transport system ATPase component